MSHAVPKGEYRYGRERLGAWPGFLGGWIVVIGKTRELRRDGAER